MTQHPIPDDALDDRLAGVGTSGSGKTYNLGTAIERVLELGRRVGIVDPLGVWWGLRLKADGKAASPWPIVIFGGPHGDLPLTENAGQLIGETCAAMAESFIIDLSELGTRAAERRFMLAFYSALYRHATGEPLHLVTDEADMFAPQTVQDKDGGALKLLGVLETIVRRGRVKGFIPWLITQRPAVLNKNVLSQADGLVAMKLTSSQDRGAIGSWIDGQADKAADKSKTKTDPAAEDSAKAAEKKAEAFDDADREAVRVDLELVASVEKGVAAVDESTGGDPTAPIVEAIGALRMISEHSPSIEAKARAIALLGKLPKGKN